jgi:hypothetical protein
VFEGGDEVAAFAVEVEEEEDEVGGISNRLGPKLFNSLALG